MGFVILLATRNCPSNKIVTEIATVFTVGVKLSAKRSKRR